MNELEIKEFDFYGDTLIVAKDKCGQIWAGVKWICEGVGLTNNQIKNERKKIQSDLVLSQGYNILALPTSGGIQKVLCIKLEFIPIWLAKISITPAMIEKNPEGVQKLVHYQLKTNDIFATVFLN